MKDKKINKYLEEAINNSSPESKLKVRLTIDDIDRNHENIMVIVRQFIEHCQIPLNINPPKK